MQTEKGKVGTPSAIAARLASKIFAERKGHGGADVSYMQISESSLANMIEAGIDADRAINNRKAHDDMKAALEEGARALLALLDAVRKEPAMQGRKYVDLGIQCTNAATKMSAALSRAQVQS